MSAVKAAMGAVQTKPFLSSILDRDAFDYDMDHVIVHLLDWLATLPKELVIGLCVCNSLLIEHLTKGLANLDGDAVLLGLPGGEDMPSPGPDAPALETRELGAWLETCDAFIFEFSSSNADAQSSVSERADAMVAGQDVLRAAIRVELARVERGERPRRFAFVNTINNWTEPLIAMHFSMSLTPYGTRLRHGAIRSRRGSADNPRTPARIVGRMRTAMGRLKTPSDVEFGIAEAIRSGLGSTGKGAACGGLFRTPLRALELSITGGAETDSGRGQANGEGRPFSAEPAGGEAFPRADPLPAGGGVFDVWDWDQPEWLRTAEALARDGGAYDWFARSPREWLHISLAHLAKLHAPRSGQAGVLVCSWAADTLAPDLSPIGDVVGARLGALGRLNDPAPNWLDHPAAFDREHMRPWSHRHIDKFDIIVFPNHSLFGRDAFAFSRMSIEILNRIEPYLSDRGKVIISCLLDIGKRPLLDRRTGMPLRLDGLRRLLGQTAFALVEPIRLRTSPATLERDEDLVLDGRVISRTVHVGAGITAAESAFVLERRVARRAEAWSRQVDFGEEVNLTYNGLEPGRYAVMTPAAGGQARVNVEVWSSGGCILHAGKDDMGGNGEWLEAPFQLSNEGSPDGRVWVSVSIDGAPAGALGRAFLRPYADLQP